MKRKLLIAFGIMALLLGFHVSIKPGEFRAVAQAGVCQFAGYGPAGQLINTTITCSTPSTGPQGTPAAGTCIGVSTPPAAGTISNLCTPSPIPNLNIMANISGISAIPAPSTGSAILDALFSSTQGSLLYRGASVWAALGPGTAGQILASGGAGANPLWTAAPSFTQATPSPTASNCIGITGSSPYTIAYTCASPTPFTTPSPTSTSTAGAPSATWTTAPGGGPQLSLLFPTSGSGSGINLQGSFPGTQQTGNGNISATFNAGTFDANFNGSGAGGFAAFANASSTNDVGFIYTTFTANDSTSHKAALFIDNSNEGNLVLGGAGPDYIWGLNNLALNAPSGSVTVHRNDGNSQGLRVIDGGVSNFTDYKVGVSGTAVTPAKGQLSCTLSALTCSVTATVVASSRCSASYDDVSTTVTLALLLPLAVDVTSTTLTIKMQGSGAATGTAAADYICL